MRTHIYLENLLGKYQEFIRIILKFAVNKLVAIFNFSYFWIERLLHYFSIFKMARFNRTFVHNIKISSLFRYNIVIWKLNLKLFKKSLKSVWIPPLVLTSIQLNQKNSSLLSPLVPQCGTFCLRTFILLRQNFSKIFLKYRSFAPDNEQHKNQRQRIAALCTRSYKRYCRMISPTVYC